jgi:hypothetical protein
MLSSVWLSCSLALPGRVVVEKSQLFETVSNEKGKADAVPPENAVVA